MHQIKSNILILNVKRFIVLLLVNPCSGFFLSFFKGSKISFKGVLIEKKALNYTQIAALTFNLYESKEILFLNKYLRKDLPCIELGSSIGIVSCQIAKLNANKKIFVEANPNLINTIHSNLSLNKFENYDVINAALAYGESKTVSFNFGSSNLTGSIQQKNKSATEVQKISINDILKQHPEIKFFTLVMDIEGAELDLIENEPENLVNCKQIIAEFHDVTFNGKKVIFSEIKEKYIKHDFKLVEEYHNRYVFEKE
jgi:FkbM family methyltransferase